MDEATIDGVTTHEPARGAAAGPRRPPPLVLCYRDGRLRDDVPFDAVDAQVAEDGSVVWLDLEHPDTGQLSRLQDELKLHPLVLQDLRLPRQRPKVDEYDGLTMVVLIAARLTHPLRLRFTPVAILIGPGYIVTIHPEPLPALKAVRDRWRANPTLIEPHPHELLLYRICEGLTEAYFPLVDTFDSRLEQIEDQLFDRFDSSLLQEVLTLRRDLTELRRVVAPPRDVFTELARHDDPNVGGSVAPYFMDLVDLVLRLTETTDTLRDRLGTALDSYLTLQSNALNQTMKRLTALTVLLTLPMIISGIYGMNFQSMPLLESDWGFWLAVGFTGVVMVVSGWLMRRAGWW